MILPYDVCVLQRTNQYLKRYDRILVYERLSSHLGIGTAYKEKISE